MTDQPTHCWRSECRNGCYYPGNGACQDQPSTPTPSGGGVAASGHAFGMAWSTSTPAPSGGDALTDDERRQLRQVVRANFGAGASAVVDGVALWLAARAAQPGTPTAAGPRVEIVEQLGKPTTCKVWSGDVLVFDGQDRTATLAQAQPSEGTSQPDNRRDSGTSTW